MKNEEEGEYRERRKERRTEREEKRGGQREKERERVRESLMYIYVILHLMIINKFAYFNSLMYDTSTLTLIS